MFKKQALKRFIALIMTITIFSSLQTSFIYAANDPTITASVSSVTQNGAQITVNITFDNTLHSPGSAFLYYSTSNPPETAGTHNPISVGAGGTFTLSDLSPSTTYYYTAVFSYTNTADGTPLEVLSQPKSFTTQAPPAPSVTISAPTVSYTGTSSATVNFSYSAANCIVTEYGVTVNDTPKDSVTPSQSGGTYNNTISGFTRDNSYFIKGYIKYSDGTGNTQIKYSNTTTYNHRDPSVKPSVTTKTAAYSASLGNISATATVVTSGTAEVTDKGFVYSFDNSNPTFSDNKYKVTGNVPANTSNFNYTGTIIPEPGKTRCYVRAYATSTVDTVYGEVITVTLPGTASVVTNAATGITANSATANIRVSDVGLGITHSGVVYGRSISYLTKENANSLCKDEINTITGTRTYNLTNLTAGTTYYAKAYVINKGGSITYDSSYVSFTTTNSSYIPSVTTVSATNMTNTTVDVTINVTSTNGYAITERGVVYSSTNSTPTLNDSNKTISGTTGSTTVTLTGLSPNKTYYVRAYAKNSQGVAYGSVKSFSTLSNSDAVPGLSTYSVSNVTAVAADVEINVTDIGSSNVTDRGVVYSSTNRNPEIGLSGCIKQSVTGTTGRTVVFLSSLSTNTTYYARSYAKNSSGYAYGDVKTFTTSRYDNMPAVTTDSVTITSSSSLDAKINVTKDNGFAVTERGVIYSKSNSNLKLYASSTYNKTITGTTGTGTVSVTDLTAGTTYYVRAYATNKNGTAYGAIKEVTTSSYSVTTGTPTNVTTAGATVSGVVSSNSDKITDRGIVYSPTNANPTFSDYYVSAKTTTASFTVALTGLAANTKYYARAYIKTSEGYSYGSSVNFTTGNSDYTLNLLYKTQDGLQVGSQTLTLKKGVTVKQDALLLPTGYQLVTPTFSYVVQGNDTITVTVKKQASTVAYMEGSANNKFEPERKITRIEVAKMIYALRGKPDVGRGKVFTDISVNHKERAAIDYVSSMEYMTGFPDGSFRPNDNITRAEVAVVCNNVYNLTSDDMTNPFTDTNKHWGRSYITIAYKNGAISGYPDKTFKPDLNMTRAEAASLFSKAEKRDLTPLGSIKFSDVPSTHWAYKYIMNAAVPKA